MSDFYLVYAGEDSEIMMDGELRAVGAAGEALQELTEEDLIPLPPGSDLLLLPGRLPIGLDVETERPMVIEEEVTSVAAILPQGYTRFFLPAYQRTPNAPRLPLFGYTAVAAGEDGLYVAAGRTDRTENWDPRSYNTPELPRLIKERLHRYPENRILRQLAKCAKEYHCQTAQNIFYQRGEGGIPTSPSCNARCLGCISLQPAECCPSPQGRINFQPTVEEIVEIALLHLEGENRVISFGQGCEGEPLMAEEVLSEAVRRIRARTKRGTINVNTNAGMPDALKRLIAAGLDSARVSLFSANPHNYLLYHRPGSFTLEEVARSIDLLRAEGVFISLNLLVFPGFTDQKREKKDLWGFLQRHPVDMIQLRTLNIDPDLFWERIGGGVDQGEGIRQMIAELKRDLPELLVGNNNRPLR